MIEIEFSYNGKDIIIKANEQENIKDIFKKFSTISSTDLNSIYFLYEGYKINDKLTLSQIININDKKNHKMKIIVNSIYFQNSHENQPIPKIKEVICPKCGESIKVKTKDYKIILYECKNKHTIDNILFDEFDKTQYIDEAKIICDNCKDKKKDSTYNNIFYKCNLCKINMCPFCKTIHNQSHNIINYDKKNYICEFHNENYHSYCYTCKKNICISCKNEHIHHHIIFFKNITPNKNDLKMKLEELRKDINIFNNNIIEIINILNKVIENIEKYYNICYKIINNIENKNYNFEILNNINEIINNNEIQKNLNVIIKEKNINEKFSNIFDIYKKMSKQYLDENNEIYITYKINKKN